MSDPSLPSEVLDYIIDFLHGKPGALKECCLVSKSWVSRTRKHLFSDIEFLSVEDLDSWKKTFPNPSNSPAYYTRTLSFRCAQAVTAAGAGVGGLIQSFSRVVQLDLIPQDIDPLSTFGSLDRTSLVPFHNFSPLKSLRVGSIELPCPQIFALVRSFPLLEDLTLFGHDALLGNDDEPLQAFVPSTTPTLTGSLNLLVGGEMENTARRLLDLPGGLRFRRLMFSWFHKRDLRWIVELVVRCSDTLECLDVRCSPPCDSSSTPIDISKAKKLRGLDFWPESLNVGWITMALQTVTPEHRDLQRISIYVPQILTLIGVGHSVGRTIEEEIHGQWSELDRVLVQSWESRSIRPKVIYTDQEKEGKERMRDWMGRLLPEMTGRGMIDLV